jgi:hypothetical protein
VPDAFTATDGLRTPAGTVASVCGGDHVTAPALCIVPVTVIRVAAAHSLIFMVFLSSSDY